MKMKVKVKELYFSVDIEADGKIPGIYSMLSFGCAVFSKEEKLIHEFSRNLECLEGATQDKDTMNWWKTQPKAWEACRKDLAHPKQAMQDFNEWVKDVCKKENGRPVFVAYPAGFDFTFVYWYLIKFCNESPFSFSALDIKSLAMGVLNKRFRDTTKRQMPKKWFNFKNKHTHVALDDAIEQGYLLLEIFKTIDENDNKKQISPIIKFGQHD